jgi:ABC-type transport system involved in cytochrome bd biosynthesis fused ATPase/permease subunit
MSSVDKQKPKGISLNSKITIQALFIVVLLLITALLVQSSNLADQRKMTIGQSNYCIKYTSDIIANNSLQLIREQDAHRRDVDRANEKITTLVNYYNDLLKKTKQKTSPLNPYSFLVLPS